MEDGAAGNAERGREPRGPPPPPSTPHPGRIIDVDGARASSTQARDLYDICDLLTIGVVLLPEATRHVRSFQVELDQAQEGVEGRAAGEALHEVHQGDHR